MFKHKPSANLFAAIAFGLLLCVSVRTGLAQEPPADYDGPRGGKFEFFADARTMMGLEAEVAPLGLDVDVESDQMTTLGGGFGMNFNNYVNVNVDLGVGSTEFTISAGAADRTVDADVMMGNANVDYNILRRRITPIVSAGVGFLNLEADEEFDVDVSGTHYTYNLGVGVRWEITDHIFIKGMYRSIWTDIDELEDTLRLDAVSFNIGWTL